MAIVLKNVAAGGGESEAGFQHTVTQFATLMGWEWYHNPDSRRSNAGFVDLVLIHPAWKRLLWVELKTQTGRVRSRQKLWRQWLESCGQTVLTVRPEDWPFLKTELSSICATCPEPAAPVSSAGGSVTPCGATTRPAGRRKRGRT